MVERLARFAWTRSGAARWSVNMNPRTFAAGIAIALLATLLAPIHTAAPQPPQAAIVLTPSSPLMVAEESAAHTYTVSLATPPASDVTVAITGFDADLSVTPASLTFKTSEWTPSQTKTVTVFVARTGTGVEGTHTYTLLHTASSMDPNYGGSTTPSRPALTASLTVYAADNDPGVVVTQSGGSTDVTEDSVNDTLVVSLGSQPAGTVRVGLVPSDPDQLTLDRFSVFFNGGNWYLPVSVKVSAVHDDIAEDTLSRSIAVTTTGSGAYGSVPAQTIPVRILDNDLVTLRFHDTGTGALTGTPPVINPSGLTSATANSEAGSAGYKVALGSQPAGTVTVALSDPTGQATPSPASLTFGPSDWNSFKPVTVTAAQDFFDEGSNAVALQVTIVHDVSSSADAAYNALPNAPAIFRYLDDDTAGYVFNGANVNASIPAPEVTEGGATASYTVKLNSQPTAPTTMALAGDGQYTVSPASILFNDTTWNQPVTVTLTAVNDLIDETDPYQATLGQTMSTTDGRYAAITQAINVKVHDNDAAGIETNLTGPVPITENGASKAIGVRLTSQPAATVTIDLVADSQLSASPSPLTFTAANWNAWQTVTVSAVNDETSETQATANVAFNAASPDTLYDPVAKTLTFSVLDDDGVVIVGESDGSTVVKEGSSGGPSGSDTFTVRLVNPPASMATVNVTVTAPAGLLVDGGSSVVLHFDNRIPDQSTSVLGLVQDTLAQLDLDPLNLTSVQAKGTAWNTPQTVTVTSANDNDVSGSALLAITQSVSSTDPNYDAGHGALARSVLVYRLDNDPGILVEETDGGTVVTEGGAADTYTVRLATAPTEGVAIVLDHDAQVSLSDSTLYFDPYGWDMPQAVTVTAVQDHVDEANTLTSTIHHRVSGNDPVYRTKTASDVVVTVNDADTAGITLTQSGGNTAVTEGGAADSYSLVLTSVPPGTVTIALGTSPGGQVTTTPSTLTFTPSTWNVAQTVSVQAVDDGLIEGPVTVAIHHTVTGFPGVTVGDVSVPVTDNDVAGVPVTETNGNTVVMEGGTGDGLNVQLSSQPVADVFVTLASTDTRLQLPSAPLKFDATNWNTAQFVWVWSRQDTAAQGTQPSAVTVSVSSSDPDYGVLSVPARSVTVVDDDTASLVAADTNGATIVTEGGAGDSFAVRLSKQPTADVTVTLSSAGNQVNLSPATLTFTAANYASPQTVNVGAVNDAVHEGTHSAAVTFSLSSSDAAYNGLSAPSKTVTINDND